MTDITLTIGGTIYDGWKQARVRRSVESIAASFEVTVSERTAAATRRAIRPGDACTVAVDGIQVLAGWVDEVAPEYDKDRHQLTIRGRSKSADLVDGSAFEIGGSGGGAFQPASEVKSRTLLQIAKVMCAPYGITVRADVDTGEPFKSFSIQQGEKVFEAVERAARMRGVLLVSDAQGRLVITRAGTERAAVELVFGRNILKAAGRFDWRERYSRYIVKGQQGGSEDNIAPADAAGVVGTATDPAVTRDRPLVIVAEGPGDAATLKERAEWEASVRAGRAGRVTYTIQGFHAGSALWQPNTRATVRDPWMGLSGDELLIAAVTFTKDEGGSLTELEVVRPEAFDRVPLPEADAEGAWAG